MTKNYDVVVNITQQAIIGSVGFGVPLILAGMESKEVPYTECGSMAEVILAGYAEGTPTYKACKLLFMQASAPSKVAVCSATEKVTTALDGLMDRAWRQLIVPSIKSEGESKVKDIAEYIETTDRLYFASVASTSELVGMTALDRTYAIIYGGVTEFPEAALVGATAGLDAGSFTYKNMVLKGIEPEKLSASQVDAIHKAHGNAILLKAGDIVPSEGKSISGQYTDVIDTKDYIISNIEYKEQKLLNLNKKIPYTNVGISMLENEVINVLKDACDKGMIATDDDGAYIYSTHFPGRSEIDAVDRADRIYDKGTFSFELSGAVHNVVINGTLSV